LSHENVSRREFRHVFLQGPSFSKGRKQGPPADRRSWTIKKTIRRRSSRFVSHKNQDGPGPDRPKGFPSAQENWRIPISLHSEAGLVTNLSHEDSLMEREILQSFHRSPESRQGGSGLRNSLSQGHRAPVSFGRNHFRRRGSPRSPRAADTNRRKTSSRGAQPSQ